MNLPTSDKYLNFRWLEPDCKVLFSVCRQGDAANIHITSDDAGKDKLEDALNDFCEFCFDIFGWCKMIMGKITIPKVEKLAEKCGFKEVMKNKRGDQR